MTNAAAVFGDYENFTKSNEVRLGNPHYYPSDIKELNEDAKRTSLNPKYVDLPQRYEHKAYAIVGGEGSIKKSDVLPESLESLMSKIDSSGSSKYNESWPATEQSLASSNPKDEPTLSLDQAAAKSKEHSVEDYLEKFNNDRDKNGTMDQWNTGTLSRFVQRFREQPPLPRTQRSTKNGDADFWWLSSPPSPTPQLLSSTPKSLNSPAGYSPSSTSRFSPDLSRSTSLFTVRGKDKEASSTTTLSPLEESESDVVRMQMRTDKLLNLTESQIRNQKTISSLQSPQENVVPKHDQDFLPVHLDPSQHTVPPPFKSGYDYSGRTDRIPLPALTQKPNLRPEDDILYKWRLSRKMNLATQSASELNDPFLSMKKGESKTNDLRFSDEKANMCQSDRTLVEKREARPSGAPSETAEDGVNKFVHDGFSDPSNECIPPCCSKDHSRVTVKPVLCRGSCGCNRGLYGHIPPHTHDECDVLPCMHNNNNNDIQRPTPISKEMRHIHPQTNKLHSQNDKDISSHNHTEKVNRENGEEETETLETTEDASGDRGGSNVTQHPATDAIAPVINQVVGAHLFDIDTTMNTSNDTLDVRDITLGTTEDSVDMVKSSSGLPNGFVGTLDNNSIAVESSCSQISHMVDADDLSDGEFSDDEILREMRCRRLRNKQELKLVCERLQIIQEEKKRNENSSNPGQRMTK